MDHARFSCMQQIRIPAKSETEIPEGYESIPLSEYRNRVGFGRSEVPAGEGILYYSQITRAWCSHAQGPSYKEKSTPIFFNSFNVFIRPKKVEEVKTAPSRVVRRKRVFLP